MTDPDVAARRLAGQQLLTPRFSRPEDLLGWMLAMQAQDFLAAKWALALRLKGHVTEADIDRAFEKGRIVRTHALRGTWQWVAPDDVDWVLDVTAQRVIDRAATRFHELGLTSAVLKKSNALVGRALEGAQLTRAELAAALRKGGVSPNGQRLSHILLRAELDRVACSGGRNQKQLTWAAYGARVQRRASVSGEVGPGALARRYFHSRGPATVADFGWWSGLTAAEARSAAALAGPEAQRGQPPPRLPANHALLLPAFDEYLVAYQDRDAVLDPADTRRINAGGGLLAPCIVLDGKVVGLWKRTLSARTVTVTLQPFIRFSSAQTRAVAEQADRYAAFVGLKLSLKRGRAAAF